MSFLPLHALRAKVADENVELWVIPTEESEAMFRYVSTMLVPAIARTDGRLTPKDVKERLADGRMQLLVLQDKTNPGDLLGAIVTEFVQHPGGSALNICLCGGRELHRWLDRLLEVERWAKHEGCRWVELSGRFGWERVLRGLNYEPHSVTLVKELS